MWWAMCGPIFTGLAGSLLIEQGLSPAPKLPWRRGAALLSAHGGIWLTLFALDLLVLQRPWFVVVLMWAFQSLLVLVNHAKFGTLREVFIVQDFEYFTDALKHPRLYLPFFGLARTAAALAGLAVAMTVGLVWESSLSGQFGWPAFLAAWLVMLATAQALLAIAAKHCPLPSEIPNDDLRAFGHWAFLWAYWQRERHSTVDLTATPFKNWPVPLPGGDWPDVLVVQSESFFDPRRLCGAINPLVLRHFDQAQTEARQFGRVDVPAWGANTVRTESGFLTGLTPAQMGIHRFNPYRLLVHLEVPNLVGWLKQAGYYTVCIHPYHATFYLRDRLFPRLGFDEFVDIRQFGAGDQSGQFIGDLAVAEKARAQLAAHPGQPVFLFLITMENHGPMHLEQPDDSQVGDFYTRPPQPPCADLTVYLQHIRNADLMIRHLQDSLRSRNRDGLLCWYGDHVPIMESVYQRFGAPDGRTDYFIWQKSASQMDQNRTAVDLSIHDLAGCVLRSAGLR